MKQAIMIIKNTKIIAKKALLSGALSLAISTALSLVVCQAVEADQASLRKNSVATTRRAETTIPYSIALSLGRNWNTNYTGLPMTTIAFAKSSQHALVFALTSPFASLTASNKVIVKEPLTFYLDSEMTTLNCYYTIEYYFSDGPLPSVLGSAEIEPKSVSTLPQLVAYLKEQLPEADVSIDKKHPSIINIADKKLAQQKDYGLSKSINIIYNGTLSGLPKAMAKATAEDIRRINSLDAAIIPTYAEHTKVNLRLKHIAGRDVLTTAAYLPGCPHELWEAMSSPNNNSIYMNIYFPYPHPN